MPKTSRTVTFLSAILLFSFSLGKLGYAESYPGLPTRSQNPLLQSYFIPSTVSTAEQGWSFSHGLYITNTYQQDEDGADLLVIDVENTRYDFQINYTHELWHLSVNLPFLSNRSGSLDQTIESWHDIFGLPQGGRDQRENNLLQLFYQDNGNTIFDSQSPDKGLGDVQLSVGYSINPNNQLWFAVELPFSSSADFISNAEVDTAFWHSGYTRAGKKLGLYSTLGLAFPADSGVFEHRLNSQVLFGQLGITYAFDPAYHFIIQADFHDQMIKNSSLDALDPSLQMQFSLRLPQLIENQQLDIFFSEDVFPGHAPDITFAIRLSSLTE